MSTNEQDRINRELSIQIARLERDVDSLARSVQSLVGEVGAVKRNLRYIAIAILANVDPVRIKEIFHTCLQFL